ncbi:universal stress protein [Legionella israelensis]|uniref:Universal stress protein family protein n=1 Tax=Legionella israelensis TaxID=454 RepID=A0A0W0WIB8_9GAMM|nr:universal stress protein [Legionella israelensis]KTD32072.1 universal stress protein family protein [Legionella israelensis]QBS10381.1 universal stress protein [Legionella israelensis]SCY33829.1 Nucleotide-binding universal stress protein, UspA family [Legionella israelensis DSM 19235]STX59992.1 Universal stress protein A [Legionella israelensis]
MSIKKAIIATDFSKHAEYALKRAVSLTESHDIMLELIHVLKQPWPANFVQFSAKDQQIELLKLEKSMEEKLQSMVQPFSSAISVNTSVLLGRAVDEIIRFTKDNQGDLIIAGAHGQYYISDHVLGTTSGDIVRQGNTPVLLIKKEPSFSYNKILIATDFSEASKKAVEFAFQCFPEARFQLLHIVDIYYRQFLNVDDVGKNERNNPTKDIFEKLDDFLKSCKVKHDKFEKKIIGGYLADAIIMQSKNWGADLLVFGTQGRSKLHYLLIGSVAKRLVQLSNIDMLTVPPGTAS